MSPESPEQMYKLVSNENDVFYISEKALNLSQMLKEMVAALNYNPEEVETSDPIMVYRAATAELKRVVEWCEHHKNDEPLPPDAKQEDVKVTEWDAAFLNIDNDELYRLICVANYLDISKLLRMSCRVVAGWLKSKTCEQMRVAFGIPTQEEQDEFNLGPKKARK